MASGTVTENSVYDCVGHPSKHDVKTIINVLLNENFTVACQSKIKNSLSLSLFNFRRFSIINIENNERLCFS